MQTLSVPKVKAAARKALAEGRLSAQLGQGCVYVARAPEGVTGPCGCAIGVALTETTRAKIKKLHVNANGLSTAARHGAFQVRPEDYIALQAIQSAHDRWAKGNEFDKPAFKATFENLINN